MRSRDVAGPLSIPPSDCHKLVAFAFLNIGKSGNRHADRLSLCLIEQII
jgi:hypothetical protein